MILRTSRKRVNLISISLMLAGMLLSVLLVQPVQADNYIDAFPTDPIAPGLHNTFTTAWLHYNAFQDGDDFYWDYWSGGQAVTMEVNALGPAIEAFRITSVDGNAFVFNSVYFDFLGTGTQGVTVRGIGPEPFQFDVPSPTAATYSPTGGSKLVTSVEVSSDDFLSDAMDDVNVEVNIPGAAVYGNGSLIANGDSSPTTGDSTDFGSTPQGTPVNRTFTINSIGALSLDLTGSPYVTLSGSGDFSVVNQPTSDPIPSGGSDTFAVQCNPSGPGTRNATVVLNNNSEAAPYTFDIRCTGTAPAAVELASFSAAVQDGAIRLEWETATELDNLGFNVYRSDAPEGGRVQLSGALIPAQNPGTPLGATYSFLDESAEPGVTYYYWLEDMDANGAATVRGPVSGQATALRRLLLARPRYAPAVPGLQSQ